MCFYPTLCFLTSQRHPSALLFSPGLPAPLWPHRPPRLHDYTLKPSLTITLNLCPFAWNNHHSRSPPECAFSVLSLLEKTAPWNRLVSPICDFQLQTYFVGFLMILSLISGQLLLPFFSVTVPMFTTFPIPIPTTDLLSLHS